MTCGCLLLAELHQTSRCLISDTWRGKLLHAVARVDAALGSFISEYVCVSERLHSSSWRLVAMVTALAGFCDIPNFLERNNACDVRRAERYVSLPRQ